MQHNDDYTVRVRIPGGEWEDLFEYNLQVDMDAVSYTHLIQNEEDLQAYKNLYYGNNTLSMPSNLRVGAHMYEDVNKEMCIRDSLNGVWLIVIFV